MKNRQFVTSDWHVGHENSIKFDQRPFRDTEHMHKVLINNYNTTVPENGICYFLGDMGFGSKDILKNVLNQLHGTKVLVLGNHDGSVNAMLELGFDAAVNGIVTYIAGQRVTMSHCPLMGLYREPTDHFANPAYRGANWHGEHKNQRFSFTDEGQFHLHGHIHSNPHTKGSKDRILLKQFDVGVPASHYRPVSFSEIESWITRVIREENKA